jgi:3-hydroxybutyryl-CoA dehydrogenase
VIVGRSARAESVVTRIGDRLERAVERGKLSPEERTAIAGRLAGGDDLTAAAGVDLVIEAVTEQLEVKRQLFAALKTAAPGVPLATNTSSFRVDEVNSRVSARERVLALHFSTQRRPCGWSRLSAAPKAIRNSSPAATPGPAASAR